MRKLHVFESVSLDGYFVDAQGGMSWAHAGGDDPEFAAWVSGNASSASDLLFGRKTYQMMASWWPSPMAAAQMPAVAAGMNAARKYVLSRTLETVDWSNSELLTGDALEAVRALKAQAGPDITILGSGEVVAQLGAAGLIDRYQFAIVPVALSGGRTLFSAPQKLRLQDYRTFGNGKVVVSYEPAAG